MSEIGLKISEKETPLEEASRIVKAMAEPRPAGDSVKAAIQRASRKLSWLSPNRVRDLWYADPRMNVSAAEINQLRGSKATIVNVVKDANDNFGLIVERLERIEALLSENARSSRSRNRKAASNSNAYRTAGNSSMDLQRN